MANQRDLRALIVLAGRIDPSLQSAMLKASGESMKLAKNTEKSVSGLNRVAGSVKSTLIGPVAALAGSLAAVLSAQKIIDTADAWTTVRSRVGLVTNGVQEQQASLNALFSIAQKTRQSYEATGDLYSKIAMNAKQLKLANGDVLKITDTVNKALRVGGGTTQQNEAAIMQFSQSLASGRLQGDELRSILENAPRLARAIASGLGVTTGSLKQLGSEGQLTSDVIIKALQSQSGAIDQEFTKMPLTIRQAFTYANNAFGKFIDDSGKKSNIFNTISQGIVSRTDKIFNGLEKLGDSKALADLIAMASKSYNFIVNNWSTIKPVIEGITVALIGLKAGLAVQGAISLVTGSWKAYKLANEGATIAQWAFNAAMSANPIGLIAIGVAAAVAATYYLWKNWDKVTAALKRAWEWLKKVFGFGDKKVNYNVGVTKTEKLARSGAGPLREFATGGLADRPSIFGDAGLEMAIPMKRSQRSFSLLEQASRILGFKAGGGSVVHLILNVDARGNSNGSSIAGTIKEAVVDALEEVLGEKVRVSLG